MTARHWLWERASEYGTSLVEKKTEILRSFRRIIELKVKNKERVTKMQKRHSLNYWHVFRSLCSETSGIGSRLTREWIQRAVKLETYYIGQQRGHRQAAFILLISLSWLCCTFRSVLIYISNDVIHSLASVWQRAHDTSVTQNVFGNATFRSVAIEPLWLVSDVQNNFRTGPK